MLFYEEMSELAGLDHFRQILTTVCSKNEPLDKFNENVKLMTKIFFINGEKEHSVQNNSGGKLRQKHCGNFT